jgi:hypothetical protein
LASGARAAAGATSIGGSTHASRVAASDRSRVAASDRSRASHTAVAGTRHPTSVSPGSSPAAHASGWRASCCLTRRGTLTAVIR